MSVDTSQRFVMLDLAWVKHVSKAMKSDLASPHRVDDLDEGHGMDFVAGKLLAVLLAKGAWGVCQ